MEFKKFRVRSPIRSFRDLEVYKKTTELSAQIHCISIADNLKNRSLVKEELQILCAISKQVPRLIAQAYGDRFSNKPLALAKLEKSMQSISDIIAKSDFLIGLLANQETKELFISLISKYQTQRRKILNLKKVWDRVYEKPQAKT